MKVELPLKCGLRFYYDPSRLTATPPLTSGPLRDGPDVSWVASHIFKHDLGGDSQGNYGACALFTVANWVEIMTLKKISDDACIDLYKKTCSALGRGDEGLTFHEAVDAAKGAGWLPKTLNLKFISDLSLLFSQPILGGFQVTDAFVDIAPSGCLDHTAKGGDYGGHAMLIVANGTVEMFRDNGPQVQCENSWSKECGYRGIVVMREDLFRDLVREMWVLQ